MKRIRRRTRNRIIGVCSTLIVLVLGVFMVTVLNKAGNDYYGLPTHLKGYLGDNIRYGVIAEEVEQSSHVNTNFAAKKYTMTNADKYGSGCGAVNGYEGGVDMLIGELNDIYIEKMNSTLTMAEEQKDKKLEDDQEIKAKNISIVYKARNKINTAIDNMITKAKTQSAADLAKSNFTLPEAKDNATIDLASDQKIVETTKVPHVTMVPVVKNNSEGEAASGEDVTSEGEAASGEDVTSDGEAASGEDVTSEGEAASGEDVTSESQQEFEEKTYYTEEEIKTTKPTEDVVYVNGIEKFFGKNNIMIKMKKGQVVVFNIPSDGEVNINPGFGITVDGKDIDDSDKGVAAASVIYNIPNATKVKINSNFSKCMTIIAPNATVVNEQCQYGWIVCKKFTHTNEWHTWITTYPPTTEPPVTEPPKTEPPVTEPPTLSYDIDVTKEVTGAEWPDGAEFKFDIKYLKHYGTLDCIDNTKDSSVILTKDERTKTIKTIKFDLSKFKGDESGDYSKKVVPGKSKGGYVEYCWYLFTVSEDPKYRPADLKGVDYSAIDYDKTQKHIKIFVNVEYDKKEGKDRKIVGYWLEPREALHVDGAICGLCGETCGPREGATKFTNKVTAPPTLSYDIDVTKEVTGAEWPDGAEFKFDIKYLKHYGTLDCIDNTKDSSVILTKDERTKTIKTIKFDLSKFKGDESGDYSKKVVPGKSKGGYVEYCWYLFTVSEDPKYRPADLKGVDYSAIDYDKTQKHIKIFVNVEYDKKEGKDRKIVGYWLEPREALHVDGAICGLCGETCGPREGATKFTNKVKVIETPTPTPTETPEVTPTPTPEVTPTPTPEVTPTPTPEVTPTPTPEVTPTPTPEVTPTPTPEVTPTPTPEVTPTPTPEITQPPTNTPPTTYTNPPSNTPPVVYYTFTPAPTETPTTVVEEEVPLSDFTPEEAPKKEVTTIVENVPLAATVPETGDTMNPMIPIAGMGLSLLAIVGVVVIRKKKLTK